MPWVSGWYSSEHAWTVELVGENYKWEQHTHMYKYICACMHVFVYPYLCTHMYLYIHVHAHVELEACLFSFIGRCGLNCRHCLENV